MLRFLLIALATVSVAARLRAREQATQHRRHPGRRPRQRRPRLPRQRDQDAATSTRWRRAACGCESFYGQPLCTPSRAALMTGRYPMRYGLQTLVIFPSHTYGLPTDERTLPQALKEAGYRTLHGRQMASRPCRQEVLAAEPRLRPLLRQPRRRGRLLHQERGGLIDWQRNGKFLKERGILHDADRRRSGEVDRRSRTPTKPFFLYFASLAPHAPYQAPQEYLDRYKAIEDDKRAATYAAMITALDDQVGRIVAALERKGMRDNTIIIFTSDNGGATSALFATGAALRRGARRKRRRGTGRQAAGVERRPSRRQRLAARGGRPRAGVLQLAGQASRGVVDEPLHMVDVMPTLLRSPARRAAPIIPSTASDVWTTLADGKPSPHEDILINVEAIPRRDPQGRLETDQGRPRCRARSSSTISPPTPARQTERRRAASRSRPRAGSDGCVAYAASRSPRSGSRPSRRFSAHRARRFSIPTSTSTTAGCRTKSRRSPSKLRPPPFASRDPGRPAPHRTGRFSGQSSPAQPRRALRAGRRPERNSLPPPVLSLQHRASPLYRGAAKNNRSFRPPNAG